MKVACDYFSYFDDSVSDDLRLKLGYAEIRNYLESSMYRSSLLTFEDLAITYVMIRTSIITHMVLRAHMANYFLLFYFT